MDGNNEELVLYKEIKKGAEYVILRDVLEANEIPYQCHERLVGSRYKTKYYYFYLSKEDIDEADACMNGGAFADLPWDPDSEDPSTEPKYPWYLDKNKSVKIGRIIIWVTLAFFVALFYWLSH